MPVSLSFLVKTRLLQVLKRHGDTGGTVTRKVRVNLDDLICSESERNHVHPLSGFSFEITAVTCKEQ